ncbi:MAG: Plug domain-containing protein, partial [Gemmatimonadota bacterium]|nr:Plug domain-containing protein [Gemmatimonadota bacterium]
GEFMTTEEIEKRNSVYATELIRRFPSINVSPSYGKGAMAEWFAISKREGANPTLGACPMAVYVDYVPMPTPFNLDLLPSPRNIAGIEVYNGPSTTPPQFAGFNRGCGVILVWTKDGY